MSALGVRADFRKQLQEGLNAVFGLEFKRYAQEWPAIFTVERSRKAFEEDVLLAGLGAAQTKSEGAGVAYDKGGEAYISRYEHETIALAFAITEEAEEDNLYGSIGAKYSRALARSMVHTKEVKGANVLNNGYDTNFGGGDGEPLFSASHPLWGGGTQANMLAVAADLSETTLEQACIDISKFVDERQIPIQVLPTRLIVPTDLQFIARKILRASLTTILGYAGSATPTTNSQVFGGVTGTNVVGATNQNAPNVIKDMFSSDPAVNHRLTDPQNWFIRTDCPDGLKHLVRIRLQRGMEGEFESGNLRYKARERYSFGWSDYRGAFGSGDI